jgi:hypothetical protein
MYLDSAPAAARRSVDSSRRRGDCNKPARQATSARAAAQASTTARRARIDDAIVSQWLLDQMPSAPRVA